MFIDELISVIVLCTHNDGWANRHEMTGVMRRFWWLICATRSPALSARFPRKEAFRLCACSKKEDILSCCHYTVVKWWFFWRRAFPLLSSTFFTFNWFLWALGFFLFSVLFLMLSVAKRTSGAPPGGSSVLLMCAHQVLSICLPFFFFLDTKRCTGPLCTFHALDLELALSLMKPQFPWVGNGM